MSRGGPPATAWVVLVVLALALASGAVSAQQQQPMFQIDEKTIEGNKVIRQELGSTLLYINVTVKAQQQNQLTDQFRIVVDLTRSGTLPDGWALSEPDPRSQTIAPGGTATFTATVTNTLQDPQSERATIKFNIRSTPNFQGQPNPVTAALVASMSQEDADTVESEVSMSLDASEKVLSFVKDYPWFFLLGALALATLGVVMVRKRKGGLDISTDTPVQEVLPGRGASYPLQIVNEGAATTSLSLTTSDVPSGWSAILPVDKIELGPNEATTLWLTLKSPSAAQPGQHIQVNFVATSGEGHTSETMLEAVVVERYGVRADEQPMGAQAPPEPAPEPQPVPVARTRRKN